MRDIKIDSSWKKALEKEFSKTYWEDLTNFVRMQYKTETVFPQGNNIFHAFDLCPFDEDKVVIVGQDPYHGVGQVNGLSFSVTMEFRFHPHLKIFIKKLKTILVLPRYNRVIFQDGQSKEYLC